MVKVRTLIYCSLNNPYLAHWGINCRLWHKSQIPLGPRKEIYCQYLRYSTNPSITTPVTLMSCVARAHRASITRPARCRCRAASNPGPPHSSMLSHTWAGLCWLLWMHKINQTRTLCYQIMVRHRKWSL